MVATLVDEVKHADLGDVRLNKRLKLLVEVLGANPNHSIPAASNSRAEWEAAYRFFDNRRVTPEKIFAPHYEATLERIGKCESVVLAQDTTVVNLTCSVDVSARRAKFRSKANYNRQADQDARVAEMEVGVCSS